MVYLNVSEYPHEMWLQVPLQNHRLVDSKVDTESEIAMTRAVEVITDPKIASILVDPMRREIVRLLAESEKTENELAGLLGLSDPSVGHHLKILREGELIRVVRKEAEEHGILQKFYESNAAVYLVDTHNMPLEIGRYFTPASLERVRGVMATASVALRREEAKLSEKDVEEFAKLFAAALVRSSTKFPKRWNGNREELLATLYRSALSDVLANPSQLPESVRKLLRSFH
jgi:DNA-binding transcriptional ArsR family regulator